MKKIRSFLAQAKNKKSFAFVDMLFYLILENNIFVSASSLAYFFILAIFPFMIAVLNTTQFFDASFMEEIRVAIQALPEDVAILVQSFVSDIQTSSSATLLTVSIIGSLFSASSGVKQMVNSIGRSFSPTNNVRSLIPGYIFAIIMTLIIFILFILIFGLQVAGSAILNYSIENFDVPNHMIRTANLAINFIPISAMLIGFFLIYRFSPLWEETLKPVNKYHFIGSVVATILILLATRGFNIYVTKFAHYSNTYGSLAGVIIFIVYLYLFGLIILFGAHVSSALHHLNQDGVKWPRRETVLGGILGSSEVLEGN